MKQELHEWGNKVRVGYDLAGQQASIWKGVPIEHLIFAGMGGSGIAGTVFKNLFANCMPSVDLQVLNTPRLPPYLAPNTGAIVASYSGNTWETLACYTQLVAADIPIFVITHGGELAARAQRDGIPYVIMPASVVPRASLGSFIGILCRLFEELGLCAGDRLVQVALAAAAAGVERYADAAYFQDFLALAQGDPQLYIWGVTGDSDAAAYRAQTQFNENSKIPALATYFPELCHNLIVGIADCKKPQLVVSFATSFLSAHEQAGLAAAYDVLAEYQIPLYRVPLVGVTWEEQLFSALLWADFASYHLGLQRGVEITPNVAIDTLKKNYVSRVTLL